MKKKTKLCNRVEGAATSSTTRSCATQKRSWKIFKRKLYQDFVFHNEYALRCVFFEGLFQVRDKKKIRGVESVLKIII